MKRAFGGVCFVAKWNAVLRNASSLAGLVFDIVGKCIGRRVVLQS